ncbi:hypothetical protein GUJ93_ZPchr0004g40529, partial [Zizania palustris]
CPSYFHVKWLQSTPTRPTRGSVLSPAPSPPAAARPLRPRPPRPPASAPDHRPPASGPDDSDGLTTIKIKGFAAVPCSGVDLRFNAVVDCRDGKECTPPVTIAFVKHGGDDPEVAGRFYFNHQHDDYFDLDDDDDDYSGEQ